MIIINGTKVEIIRLFLIRFCIFVQIELSECLLKYSAASKQQTFFLYIISETFTSHYKQFLKTIWF